MTESDAVAPDIRPAIGAVVLTVLSLWLWPLLIFSVAQAIRVLRRTHGRWTAAPIIAVVVLAVDAWVVALASVGLALTN